MKKKKKRATASVRISVRLYQAARRAAFHKHKPIVEIIEECITNTLYRKV